MAEIAVSFALDQLFPILKEKAGRLSSKLGGVHKDLADVKNELESIRAFLKDADAKAETIGDNTSDDGIKAWVKELREAAFRIEDVIDEYIIYVAHQPHDPGCAVLLRKICRLLKNLKPRYQIASEIEDIKTCVREISERRVRYDFHRSFEQGSAGSVESQNVRWHDPRVASLFIEEGEVVGIEAARDELIGWLVDEFADRTVIAVVGMGGLGKTTLAKKVYDNQEVIRHFDCHAWITVSQTYTVKGLLKNVLEQFCRERRESLPQGMDTMDGKSLIDEVRKYLQEKRYVVMFDDVWNMHFWGEIENALFDNKIGSRTLITTRNMGIAEFCKQSSFVHVHKLQNLPPEKSWELFCKKAFRFEHDKRCPEDLEDISREIVKKCEGLPLAISVIGGLLSTKEKNAFEWQRFCRNIKSELELNSNLTSITKILALSYDDLPYYLKSCFLYFGTYPEDYAVSGERVISQWIAEAFVRKEKGKTLEEVANQYLNELIHRSLVQVLEIDYEARALTCRVHDLLREMIAKKMEDLSFCCFVTEDHDQSILRGTIRRLSIATRSNDFMESTEGSRVRSLYIFRDTEFPESFVSSVPTEYKLLKVLDFENSLLHYVPKNLGNLLHLRYLSLRNTKITSLPKSIGKLQNLESLDLRQTNVNELPREITKLKKLRHLRAYPPDVPFGSRISGSRMVHGTGSLTSLETLYYVDIFHAGIKLITELKKLTKLRVLGLTSVAQECGSTLCSMINEMHHLEALDITAFDVHIIDLQYLSSPPQLRKLFLEGKLERLPDWLQKLQCLVELSLFNSNLTDDPLMLLKNLPNLLYLSICNHAYEGESLHFQHGGFKKLKELRLEDLSSLNFILIDGGALPTLARLRLWLLTQLREVPSGMHHLEKLEVLDIHGIPQLDWTSVSIPMKDKSTGSLSTGPAPGGASFMV